VVIIDAPSSGAAARRPEPPGGRAPPGPAGLRTRDRPDRDAFPGLV